MAKQPPGNKVQGRSPQSQPTKPSSKAQTHAHSSDMAKYNCIKKSMAQQNFTNNASYNAVLK
jgi:hypothetical protein